MNTVKLHIEQKLSRPWVVSLGLLMLLFVLFLLSLKHGAYPIASADVWQIIVYKLGLGNEYTDTKQLNILWHIRLPRVLLTAMIGGSLAMVGGAFQGVFRNPLVEPGLIGVSSGSALFSVLFIVFAGSLGWSASAWYILGLQSIAAFAGGLLFTFLAYSLSLKAGKADIALLILAGVAMNALAGALIGLVIYHADDNAIRSFTFWSLGDMGGANWSKVQIATLLVLLPAVLIGTQAKALNALSLGESEAFHLGIPVQRVKNMVLFMGALSVASGVSIVGIIGFVGLIIPHISRLAFGSDHNTVLPASFFLGASLLVMADLLARLLVSPAELPIGIITALIGAPFFIWLILRIRKQTSL